MAPIGGSAEQVDKLRNKINNAAVLVFTKSFCPYCKKVSVRFSPFISSNRLWSGSTIWKFHLDTLIWT